MWKLDQARPLFPSKLKNSHCIYFTDLRDFGGRLFFLAFCKYLNSLFTHRTGPLELARTSYLERLPLKSFRGIHQLLTESDLIITNDCIFRDYWEMLFSSYQAG